jgi:hypothetical protein
LDRPELIICGKQPELCVRHLCSNDLAGKLKGKPESYDFANRANR